MLGRQKLMKVLCIQKFAVRFGSVHSNKLSNVGNLLDFPSIYLWTNPIAIDTANKKIKVADMCLCNVGNLVLR